MVLRRIRPEPTANTHVRHGEMVTRLAQQERAKSGNPAARPHNNQVDDPIVGLRIRGYVGVGCNVARVDTCRRISCHGKQ